MDSIGSGKWDIRPRKEGSINNMVRARTGQLNILKMRRLFPGGKNGGGQQHSSILPLLLLKIRVERSTPWLKTSYNLEVRELLLDAIKLRLGRRHSREDDGLVTLEGLVGEGPDKRHGRGSG